MHLHAMITHRHKIITMMSALGGLSPDQGGQRKVSEEVMPDLRREGWPGVNQ